MSSWKIHNTGDAKPTNLDWLWKGYLATGKIALLDGDPAMGKSLLMLDLIARLSRGAAMPDGSIPPQPLTSMLISAEDDLADTILPRAQAANADLSRLIVPDFGDQLPRLPHDIPALEESIVEHHVKLVVIDPLMAFLPPNVTASVDQCVRQALSPLATIAIRHNCAIKFVRHLTKRQPSRAIHRGQGSMGIVAAARTAWFVAPNPSDPDGRVLTVSKSNVGRQPPALGFRVVESPSGQPVIEWTGPVNQSADNLCEKKRSTQVKPRDRAIDWLKRQLADGPKKCADLYAAAAEVGIPERTLDRAKEQLPARSHRTYDYESCRGEWFWYDSDADWPKNPPFKKPFEYPPLPPLEEM
jgi:AAA domain